MIQNMLVIIKFLISVKGDRDSFCLLFFFIFQSFQAGFFFCPSHNIITCWTMINQKLLERTKFAYIYRSAFSLVIDITFGNVK